MKNDIEGINMLGIRIHNGLRNKKVTAKYMAECTGLTEASISNYINGQRTPNLKALIAMADFFETSIDDLIGRKVEKT